ncbi:MAG TPA: MlaD family protein [Methylomirabilota bacterium]|jgi:phospholipid/cholesterol/gamma-HCH transport system substrate-binding protein|nr:MlaD family protein [Methylomirabilota bacterium]
MKNTLETRLGIFVMLAVIAAFFILETVGGIDRFRRGYHVNALFHNVQELKVGDRVKMAGVEIGRVQTISLTNNKVMVSMKLHKNADVKTDSTATVKFTGLLSQNFVSVDFGSPTAPRAEEGFFLNSVEQPDLSAMMQKLDNVATGVENLTKSFTGDKIDNLLGPFTDFLNANKVPLTATIANLQAVSGQISSGKGTVGKLIYDESLYNSAMNSVSNLQDAASEIKVTIADARRVIDQANSGQGTVGKLLKDETLYRETTASMTNLKEILQKINQGQGSVGKLVNDQEFYKNAKLTLQKLDKATEGLEDQGPLSVLGIVVNNLF